MHNKLSITFSAIVPEEKESIEAIHKALRDLKPGVINALLGAYIENATGIPPYLIHFPKIEAGFVPSPEQEDEFLTDAVNSIESEVEDGNTNIRDLARRCINYGLYSPVDAVDLTCERMAGDEDDDEESEEDDGDEPFTGPCLNGREEHTPNEYGDCDECRARVFITPQLPMVTPPVNPTADASNPDVVGILDEVGTFLEKIEADEFYSFIPEWTRKVRLLQERCSTSAVKTPVTSEAMQLVNDAVGFIDECSEAEFAVDGDQERVMDLLERARTLQKYFALTLIGAEQDLILAKQAPAAVTSATPPSLTGVLDEVEGFIAGFEDDELQENIPEMLGRVRALRKQCSEERPIAMKTAFLAVFHGVIGAYYGSEGNHGSTTRYRALWPTDGRFDTDLFFAARREAIEQSAKLLGLERHLCLNPPGFIDDQEGEALRNWAEHAGWMIDLQDWVEEAGWILPSDD